jgi:hypothetical protein
MSSISLLFLMALSLLLSGCSTSMNGSINSTPDPTYVFDRAAPVLVTVPQKSENSLQSKHYVSRVVSSLKNHGFTDIHTEGDPSQAKIPIKTVFFVEVSKKTASYKYRGADYGTVQAGSTTNCNSYAYGNMGTANCLTTPTTSYGVVGYSDKVGYTTGYFFTIFAFDAQSKQKVLSLLASSYKKGCAEYKLYDFLADQALSRMSFDQMVQQKFSVKMPEGYHCK